MSMIESMKERRSRYGLTHTLSISQQQLYDLLAGCLLQAPSAFNMQSARMAVLVKQQHTALWKLVLEVLRPHVLPQQWAKTEEKIKAFSAAYGTILYFEDQTVIKTMQQTFSLYKDNFPIWAQQANGMLQFAVWTALAEAGIGASLQHYNPLIDTAVAETFDFPSSWQLIAQMPFGTPTAPAADKTYVPLEKRLVVKN